MTEARRTTSDEATRHPPRCPSASGAEIRPIRFRERVDDFRVDEWLDIEPSGQGEHLWLRIRKRERDTPEIARGLARACGVPIRDVGYAGLKDRHAVTSQWFSVRGATREHVPASEPGMEVLEAALHGRKLRRGAHRGNRFVLHLRGLTPACRRRLEAELDVVRARGFPNYFGPQRFGSGGRNLSLGHDLLLRADGAPRRRRLDRTRRSLALSAVRAALFNAVLAARVTAGHWRTPLVGEPMQLAGSQSFFLVERESDRTRLIERIASADIATTGPLVGSPRTLAAHDCEAFEAAALERWCSLGDALAAAGLEAGRRALIARVYRLEVQPVDEDGLVLSFGLDRGVFATSLLAEIGVQGAGFA